MDEKPTRRWKARQEFSTNRGFGPSNARSSGHKCCGRGAAEELSGDGEFIMNRSCVTRLLAVLLLALCHGSATAQEVALRNAPDAVKFAAIGDAGTGDPPQYDIAESDDAVPREVPVRPGHHARRQHLRRAGAIGPRQEVLAAVQSAARHRRQVLRLARQP